MSRRKTRFHARWRTDADYRRRLTAKDRAWLKKFEDEFYRAEFGEEPIHTSSAHREEIYDRQNAGARDLVTASSDDVAEALGRTFDRPSLQVRHYQPGDYQMFGRSAAPAAGELEGVLLEAVSPGAPKTPQDHDTSNEFPRPCVRLRRTG